MSSFLVQNVTLSELNGKTKNNKKARIFFKNYIVCHSLQLVRKKELVNMNIVFVKMNATITVLKHHADKLA
jgi:hypothetical protein